MFHKKVTLNKFEKPSFRPPPNGAQLLPDCKITAGCVSQTPNIEVWVKENAARRCFTMRPHLGLLKKRLKDLKDCTDLGATTNPFCVFMTTGVPWFLGDLPPSVSLIHTTY